MTTDPPVKGKRRWYVLERLIIGQWTIVDTSLVMHMTRLQAIWVNDSCKSDHRWKTYEQD